MKTRMKIFHPESVRFPAQNQVKTKKKSSLKFSPIFGRKLGKGQKKRSSPTVCVLKPSAQVTKGWAAMMHFCILFYANYTILANRRGAMAQCPPKYAPADQPIRYYPQSCKQGL